MLVAMCDNDNFNVVTDEVKLINKYKNKGSPELNQLSLTKVWSCLLTINEPSPAILDLLLSEVILRELAWVRISYVFVYSKSLRPTYFRALI